MAVVAINDWRVPGHPPEVVLREITEAVKPLNGIRVDQSGPGVITIVHRRTPGWAIVLAIVLVWVFLLGLLFFLVKKEDLLTVTATADGDGTIVSANGETAKYAKEFLDKKLGVTEWRERAAA